MIRSLIVYPENEDCQTVLSLLARESDVAIVGVCTDGDDALEKIQSLRPDAVFTGTNVPGLPNLSALTSPDFAKHPYLVVMSPRAANAIEAFEANAIDYLVLPINHARLKMALFKLHRNIEADQRLERRLDLDTLVGYLKRYSPAAPDRQDERVPINFGGRYRFISMKAIRYLQADSNYVDIHLITGEILHSNSRISEMVQKLPPERFLRIRRSTIVSTDHIREARARKDHYEIVLDNGIVFRPGSTYRLKVRAALVKNQGVDSSPMAFEALVASAGEV